MKATRVFILFGAIFIAYSSHATDNATVHNGKCGRDQRYLAPQIKDSFKRPEGEIAGAIPKVGTAPAFDENPYNQEARTRALTGAREYLNNISDALTALYGSGRATERDRFRPVLIIGGGPHAAVAVTRLKEQHGQDFRPFVLESGGVNSEAVFGSPRPGDTHMTAFLQSVGSYFPDNVLRLFPILSLQRLFGAKRGQYPPSSGVGDLTELALMENPADLMLRTSAQWVVPKELVYKIKELQRTNPGEFNKLPNKLKELAKEDPSKWGGNGANFLVVTNMNGKTQRLFTDVVLNGSGLGIPNTPFKAGTPADKLVRAEWEKLRGRGAGPKPDVAVREASEFFRAHAEDLADVHRRGPVWISGTGYSAAVVANNLASSMPANGQPARWLTSRLPAEGGTEHRLIEYTNSEFFVGDLKAPPQVKQIPFTQSVEVTFVDADGKTHKMVAPADRFAYFDQLNQYNKKDTKDPRYFLTVRSLKPRIIIVPSTAGGLDVQASGTTGKVKMSAKLVPGAEVPDAAVARKLFGDRAVQTLTGELTAEGVLVAANGQSNNLYRDMFKPPAEEGPAKEGQPKVEVDVDTVDVSGEITPGYTNADTTYTGTVSRSTHKVRVKVGDQTLEVELPPTAVTTIGPSGNTATRGPIDPATGRERKPTLTDAKTLEGHGSSNTSPDSLAANVPLTRALIEGIEDLVKESNRRYKANATEPLGPPIPANAVNLGNAPKKEDAGKTPPAEVSVPLSPSEQIITYNPNNPTSTRLLAAGVFSTLRSHLTGFRFAPTDKPAQVRFEFRREGDKLITVVHGLDPVAAAKVAGSLPEGVRKALLNYLTRVDRVGAIIGVAPNGGLTNLRLDTPVNQIGRLIDERMLKFNRNEITSDDVAHAFDNLPREVESPNDPTKVAEWIRRAIPEYFPFRAEDVKVDPAIQNPNGRLVYNVRNGDSKSPDVIVLQFPAGAGKTAAGSEKLHSPAVEEGIRTLHAHWLLEEAGVADLTSLEVVRAAPYTSKRQGEDPLRGFYVVYKPRSEATVLGHAEGKAQLNDVRIATGFARTIAKLHSTERPVTVPAGGFYPKARDWITDRVAKAPAAEQAALKKFLEGPVFKGKLSHGEPLLEYVVVENGETTGDARKVRLAGVQKVGEGHHPLNDLVVFLNSLRDAKDGSGKPVLTAEKRAEMEAYTLAEYAREMKLDRNELTKVVALLRK